MVVIYQASSTTLKWIVEYLQTDAVSIWQAEMLWRSCRDHKLGLWAEAFTIILFGFLGLWFFQQLCQLVLLNHVSLGFTVCDRELRIWGVLAEQNISADG